VLLHDFDCGPVLWKLKHPLPPLNVANPLFSFQYDRSLHDAHLHQDLNLSHLDTTLQQTIYALIIKYWPVFDNRGVFIPIMNYECVIDTRNTHPIAIKKIVYGPKKIPIMPKAMAALKKVGHICQIHNGRWLFKAVLVPKPHQEHVRHIEDFVWRFCVNYVPLNLVTRIIPHLIPCCNSAVSEEFWAGQ
jgi:hypothetical protein